MGATIDRQLDKIPTGQRIQVIASFSRSGRIKPLYAKLECYTAKVTIMSYKEEINYGEETVLYKCMYKTVEIEGDYRIIFLRYYIRLHAWQMDTEQTLMK